jgi:hypothetical protein
MPPTLFDIDSIVTAVLVRAKELREAGVTRFALGELAVDLAPYEPDIDDSPAAEQTTPSKKASIWNDHDLYGRPEDAPIPGLRKNEE